ncbi:VPS35 [Auxenochlorella protothecoides x Auxenochlorella symbiontica]
MAATLSSAPRGDVVGQNQWLKEAIVNIKRNAYGLRKAMDEDNVKDALRYSAAMLGELRTSSLGPQKYYEMYMQVSDQLHFLTEYFADEHRKGRSYADLYELVQHAGNLLPRLYLLCTVGACYIRSRQAPAKLILRDVAELCRGVQHPTRGLFLRAYLVQAYRSLLPATGSPYESPEGGNVEDAADFLLLNFTEMNKLWVRLQHQGGSADQGRRETERRELADLVGKNLTYISQLEGLTFAAYQNRVLPRVLEQVVSCRDELAQQYLMQALILAFPDDFHLGTLGTLLDALPGLQPGVKVATVLSSLLDRLASYAGANPTAVGQMTEQDAFGTLAGVALRVTQRHPDTLVADVAGMYAALLAFAGTVYPERLEHVDMVLGNCHDALRSRGTVPAGKAEREVVALLSTPLNKYDVVTVLGLKQYPAVLSLLRPNMQREVALNIAQSLLRRGARISSAEHAGLLLGLLAPLLHDVDGIELDSSDIEDDSALVARVVHVMVAADSDEQHRVLDVLQAALVRGSPERQRHTLPTVAFVALKTFRDVAEGKAQAKEFPAEAWAKRVHAAVSALAAVPAADAALALFLVAAAVASESARLELVTYDLFEQAFLLYEESVPDSRRQASALAAIVGTLHRCRVLDADARGALVHKAAGYCSKLLRRADQCLAVLAVSHLYYQEEGAEEGAEETDASQSDATGAHPAPPGTGQDPPPHPAVRDGAAVLSCLKRALRITHAQQQQLLQTGRGELEGPGFLFVEILNHYLYYYERGVAAITLSALQNMVDLVASELSSEACKESETLQTFYANTLDHVRRQQGGDGAGLYAGLRLGAH